MSSVAFVTPFDEETKEAKNIILSPHFYWIKKIDIPIKSLFEAKKMAPSLFAYLEDKNLSYTAFKEKNGYFVIAYDKKEIKKILKRLGYRWDELNIYFLQHILAKSDSSCYKTDSCVLIKEEDIWFCLPKAECKENLEDFLKSIKIKAKKIELKESKHDKTLLLFAAYSFMLMFFCALEFGIYFYEEKKIEKKRFELLKKEGFNTSYELKSVYKRFENIKEKKEKIFRKLKKLKELQLKKDESLFLLEYKNGGFLVGIKTKRKEMLEKLLNAKAIKSNNDRVLFKI